MNSRPKNELLWAAILTGLLFLIALGVAAFGLHFVHFATPRRVLVPTPIPTVTTILVPTPYPSPSGFPVDVLVPSPLPEPTPYPVPVLVPTPVPASPPPTIQQRPGIVAPSPPPPSPSPSCPVVSFLLAQC